MSVGAGLSNVAASLMATIELGAGRTVLRCSLSGRKNLTAAGCTSPLQRLLDLELVDQNLVIGALCKLGGVKLVAFPEYITFRVEVAIGNMKGNW